MKKVEEWQVDEKLEPHWLQPRTLIETQLIAIQDAT
jgi:hypothetical protein